MKSFAVLLAWRLAGLDLHVIQGAEPGGDGSAERPFGTVQACADALSIGGAAATGPLNVTVSVEPIRCVLHEGRSGAQFFRSQRPACFRLPPLQFAGVCFYFSQVADSDISQLLG